ncbi:uncharacterized protein LOC112494416 [Cephus cinctus]|uniref:Uncharacterized protein LOC112494416 n=1 Tax=Cephus cinctus TaxID=211228 RepID=A0AAJ7RJ62_CEPCN|nr:uncharacterized protein LOC112494416 [Cephus cinctus]
MEDYVMDMKTGHMNSEGKVIIHPTKKKLFKPKSKPKIQFSEKELAPGVTQRTTKIEETETCSGRKKIIHSSYVINENTGTFISVQRIDISPGCRNMNKRNF